MEITDMAIMIVNWVREIKSIPPTPTLLRRRGEGKKNKPLHPPPAGRGFVREELWGVIKHFNNTQSSGFSLGLWGF